MAPWLGSVGTLGGVPAPQDPLTWFVLAPARHRPPGRGSGNATQAVFAAIIPMRTPEQIEALIPLAGRSAQRFPRLRDPQLEIVKRFATAPTRTFAPGEPLFKVGDCGVPSWFLLTGSAEVFGTDGVDQPTTIRTAEKSWAVRRERRRVSRTTRLSQRAFRVLR